MELKEQRYVVTLADTGNLTRAAGILNISQPALSLYIKNLESQYKQDLFTRENRRLKPTYFGEMYIEKARKILKIGEEFKDEMNVIKNGSKGRVVLGIPSWRTAIILPKILPEFKAQYEDIDVEIIEDTEEVLYDYLKHGKIDFYIGVESRDMTKIENITKDRILLVASDKHPVNEKAKAGKGSYQRLTISDIRDEQFILVNSESKENHLPFTINETKSFRPEKVTKFNTIESALTLVKEKIGLTLIPERRISNLDLNGCKVFEVDSHEFNINMGLVTLNKAKQNPFSVVMMGMINNMFKNREN